MFLCNNVQFTKLCDVFVDSHIWHYACVLLIQFINVCAYTPNWSVLIKTSLKIHLIRYRVIFFRARYGFWRSMHFGTLCCEWNRIAIIPNSRTWNAKWNQWAVRIEFKYAPICERLLGNASEIRSVCSKCAPIADYIWLTFYKLCSNSRHILSAFIWILQSRTRIFPYIRNAINNLDVASKLQLSLFASNKLLSILNFDTHIAHAYTHTETFQNKERINGRRWIVHVYVFRLTYFVICICICVCIRHDSTCCPE